jgi:hypothetical protein
MGLLLILHGTSSTIWLAMPFLILLGGLGGYLVVPMNALLQHRGHNLMGAGRSIAVQNFNEQACILGLGAFYSLSLKLGLSVFGAITAFGLVVAGTMWLIRRWHERLTRLALLRVALALGAAMVILWPEPAAAWPLPRTLPECLGLLGGFAFRAHQRDAAPRGGAAPRALAPWRCSPAGALVAAVLATVLTLQGHVPGLPAPAFGWIAGALGMGAGVPGGQPGPAVRRGPPAGQCHRRDHADRGAVRQRLVGAGAGRRHDGRAAGGRRPGHRGCGAAGGARTPRALTPRAPSASAVDQVTGALLLLLPLLLPLPLPPSRRLRRLRLVGRSGSKPSWRNWRRSSSSSSGLAR